MSDNLASDVELHFLTENAKRRFETEYFQKLFRGVIEQLSSIDSAITPHLDRPLADVDPIEKAVLRVAVFELSDCPDVPYRVVINEAIELAKVFAADDSHKFVNGVLDKAVKLIRPNE
jgi:N utilization substance protein B